MKIHCIVFLLSCALPAIAQQPETKPAPPDQDSSAEPRTFRLWEEAVPGALGSDKSDIPTITWYAPWNRNEATTAVIVMPGGGYQFLATNHEGRQVANWLNALHVTAFVLKYRLGPRYHHPVEMEDAQRAMRLVRLRAREFNIRPDRLGVMGFSAGGHLASTTGTHFDVGNPSAADPIDRVSCRPDFMILAYPVISFTAEYSHKGSAKALLGDNPSPALVKELSNEFQIKPDTQPTFLFSTNADTGVPPENSVAFYLALRKAGVPAEIHIFEKGPHGVGLDLADPALSEWSTLLANWLRGRGLLQN